MKESRTKVPANVRTVRNAVTGAVSIRKRAPDRIINATKSLQDYMNTYDQQVEYDKYTDGIFINDVLYGLGIALEPELYRNNSGYEAFKKKLREHLGG